MKKGILTKAEAEQILRQAIEAIKTSDTGDRAAELLAIALERLSKFQPAPRQIEGSLGGKWVELLKEIAPRVVRVSLLFNPVMATFLEDYLNPFKAAAASLGVEAIIGPVHDTSELESVIAAHAHESNSGGFGAYLNSRLAGFHSRFGREAKELHADPPTRFARVA